MNNKQDEINHLKHLHMEYKKKYNSKKQTIEEENKTISESNSSNQLNNINNEVNPKYNRKTYDKDNNASKEINVTIENKDKSNKTQANNTLYSLSEHGSVGRCRSYRNIPVSLRSSVHPAFL